MLTASTDLQEPKSTPVRRWLDLLPGGPLLLRYRRGSAPDLRQQCCAAHRRLWV